MVKSFKDTDVIVCLICVFCLIAIFVGALLSAFYDRRREKMLSDVTEIFHVNSDQLLSQGKLPIKTLWEYYAGVHIISDSSSGPPDHLQYLPMDWSMFDKDAWGGNGKASYRIVLEDVPDEPLTLYFSGVSPSLRIYVDGILAGGRRDCSMREAAVSCSGSSCEIVLEVSSDWLTGVYACPWLYTEECYSQYKELSSSIWMLSLGGFSTAFLFGMMLLRKLRERWLFYLFSRSFILIGLFYLSANYEMSSATSALYEYIPFEQLHIAVSVVAVALGLTAVKLQISIFPEIYDRRIAWPITCALFLAIALRLFIGAYFDMDILIITLSAVFVVYQIICTAINAKSGTGLVWVSGATVLIGVGIAVTAVNSSQHVLHGAYIVLPLSLLCAIMSYANFWALSFAKIEEAAARESEAKEKLMNAEIAYLTSQIQPHFQYNTLTMIQELCYTDPQKAADAVVMFSSFLRRRVDFNKYEKLVPFSDELRSIDEYMALQKLRFEDKINLETDIETEDFLIPPLSIQTLVENAVHHGLRKSPSGGGTVKLSVRKAERCIRITVSDNGVGFDTKSVTPMSMGSGIENCRFRIESLLSGSVEINSTIGRGTEVLISIPLPKSGKGART